MPRRSRTTSVREGSVDATLEGIEAWHAAAVPPSGCPSGVGSAGPETPRWNDCWQEQDQPMAHLTLAGVSDDGKRLLLVSDSGAEFTLDVDTRLRAALRGEHIRFGQLEIKMDSALRPRDIQARIRSGESPEAVAEAAQTSVDKIMAFAAPVLAEREHVAQRAQRSSVRRRSGDAGGARPRSGPAPPRPPPPAHVPGQRGAGAPRGQ